MLFLIYDLVTRGRVLIGKARPPSEGKQLVFLPNIIMNLGTETYLMSFNRLQLLSLLQLKLSHLQVGF